MKNLFTMNLKWRLNILCTKSDNISWGSGFGSDEEELTSINFVINCNVNFLYLWYLLISIVKVFHLIALYISHKKSNVIMWKIFVIKSFSIVWTSHHHHHHHQRLGLHPSGSISTQGLIWPSLQRSSRLHLQPLYSLELSLFT